MADDDLRLGISAVDRGAARLVKEITEALRALSSVQAQHAQNTKAQAAATKTAADSLKQQASIAIAAANAEKSRLEAIKQSSREAIAAIRAERDAEVDAQKVIARGRLESARGLAQMKKEALDVAKTTRQTVQTAQGAITLPPDRAQIAAKRRELAEANENIARARAQNVKAIADARRLGSAEEEAANKSVRSQRKVVDAANARATAAQKASKAADSDARAQERAAQRAEAAFRRQQQAMQTTKNISSQLTNVILRLVAAYSGFRAIEGFIGAGLRFNQIIESSRLGIGALITAEADLFDIQGKQLTGTQALASAQGLAADQLDKLRVAGIQTAATTEDLVTAFEEAVGAGLAVGLNLDQIRKFTVSIAQAASAIHLPMNQLQQETRSILQGTIDRNSRIAKALQLTNEEVRLAKEQGRLAQLLEERFKAFNLAGIESVKTFGALKSNIADAFSVFAGRATEPLFRELRDAGGRALSEIFDFKSADISRSFQGLVEGLQVMFQQIGGLLADAIRVAVEKAEALSAWMAKNREEVKQTAAAVRTMVEDFGHMISSIVSVIASVGSLGSSTNTVIGLARILSAIFQTIAEQVGLIVSLLTATKLINAVRTIATLFTVGATGAALINPIGAVIAALISLGVAYKLITGYQKNLALETARTTTALQDQTQTASEVLGTLTSLQRQLSVNGISEEERANLMDQVFAAQQRLRDLGPEYGRIVDDNTNSIKAQREELRKLLVAQVEQQRVNLFQARDELERARQDRASAAQPKLTLPFLTMKIDKGKLAEADKILEERRANVETLERAYNKLIDTTAHALETPARVRGREKTDEAANKDRNDAVQRAQAELEVTKDTNAARLDLARIQFKRGLISQIDVIKAERAAAIAEMDAEMKVLEAQRDLAARRVIKGKVVPDQGGIDAANAKITGLQNKRTLEEQETNEEIEQLRQDHLDKTAKIEEDFARASGRRLEAIRLDIAQRHQQELRDAIREFGPESDQVIHLRFVISQESIEEQAKAIEDEIHRIQENVQREIATARLRILGPDAQRGTGNAQQRQQLADAITSANERGIARTKEFRAALVELKAAAADTNVKSFIQDLIDQIDQFAVKAKEIDLTLKRLKEGIAEAFVSGLADFFDSLTDKTRSLSQSFGDMVRSILRDISRLVSRLLAEKIVFGIGSLFGGGGQVGNSTQSGGRAEGGLARPPHGLLKGGIPGTDSIHIAAMPKEYFVQTKAVDHYGVELFDMLNKMQLPRVDPRSFRPLAFGGGALEPATVTARSSTRQDVHHHFSVDDDGFLRILHGRPGREATLGHIRKNPRAVSGVIRQGRKQ